MGRFQRKRDLRSTAKNCIQNQVHQIEHFRSKTFQEYISKNDECMDDVHFRTEISQKKRTHIM